MDDRTTWIAARAYSIWEQQGCPEGRSEQHWAQASEEFDLRVRTRASDDGAEVLELARGYQDDETSAD